MQQPQPIKLEKCHLVGHAKSNDDEDKKISATERQQVHTNPTATLTDENNDWLVNNVLPWLSDNNTTTNDDSTCCSDSTTPHLMQQWLNLTHLSTLTQEDYETRLHQMQTAGTGPPHVDHPVHSPSTNQHMQDTGARMFEGTICAPQGINMHLKRFWEKQLAEGAHCHSPTPPSASSDDSDSTPPKRNQKRPAVAGTKPPTKKPPAKSKKTPQTCTPSASVIFTGPPPNATEAELLQWVAFWLHCCPTGTTPEGTIQSLAPGFPTPQWVQTWADNARRGAANASSNNPGAAMLEANPPAPPAAATTHAEPPSANDTPDADLSDAAATCTAATCNVSPSTEDLTKEEAELISNHIIPWLSHNDISLNNNGTFHSESTIPSLVQQWLLRRGAVPAAAAPSTAASDAAPPLDTTDDAIADAVHEWIRSHRITVTNGVIRCFDPDHTVPKHAQDRVACNLAQIASLNDARKANKSNNSYQQKEKHPQPMLKTLIQRETTETVNTNDPPAAEAADPDPSDAAENTTMEIKAQGDTAEDPIIINESTSNYDNDSAHEAKKSP